MISGSRISKTKILQGLAKDMAEDYGLEPNDLVIITISLEKIVGDPTSYLLSKLQTSKKTEDAQDD